MRPSVHNRVARFRVNVRLLEEAQDKARQMGMSVPELMRHALRRELEAA